MVLFVSYFAELGGAGRVLLDFATGLDSQAALVCPAGPLAAAGEAAGLRVFPIRQHSLLVRGGVLRPVAATARLAAHGVEVRRLIRALGPEAVIAWGIRSALALLWPRTSASPIVFQHNDLLPAGLIGKIAAQAARRARLVIALSNAIAAELDPHGRMGGRMVVVQPGVDTAAYPETDPPFDPPTVLVLGALVEWKRPDLALEAFAIARREIPRARLRIVGAPLEGAERVLTRLRSRAAQPDLAGAVELPGPVRDSRLALARASILLHCTPREPFGMAVLEALAAGRPAVVPAAAGPLEIVDESCGRFYEPADHRDAAEKLCALLRDPDQCRRLGHAGRGRAAARFDLEHSREGYRAALAPLLGRERRPSDVPAPLAIVTVTHNSRAELETLLESLRRHLPRSELVIADSDSSDDTAALARSWPGAAVIELTRNRGFGYACNRALAQVASPVVALLNPDVELVDSSLSDLAGEAIRGGGERKLLAPLVLYPDGAPQDTVHPRPASLADLARSLVPPALLPWPAALRLEPWRAREPVRVGWAVGCALVARTDLLRRLGPFDERIFLYGEDLDLCLRAAEQGVETWFWPSARVLHHRAHSTSRAFGGEPFELLARGRHDVVERRLGSRAARLDDAAQALTFRSRSVLKRLLGRPDERERRQLAALRSASR